MYFVDFPLEIVTSIKEVRLEDLRCHEEVVGNRLSSFIEYLKTLDGDVLMSSIIVCDETMIIVDGHHRYHALKHFGVRKIPVTFIKYNSPQIKAYYDDRISKSEIVDIVNSGKLLSPKSSKHVIFDNKQKIYVPILLLSSMWYFNIKLLK